MTNLFELLFPRHCEICHRGTSAPDRYICENCRNNLPLVNGDVCAKCGIKMLTGGREIVCSSCQSRSTSPNFDKAASAMEFAGPAHKMILDYKYNRHTWMWPDFVDIMLRIASLRFELPEIDIVTQMPSTRFHLMDRGFDHCGLLATGFARRIERKYVPDVLKRVGSPKRQAGLSRKERLTNVIGTFAPQKPQFAKGRTILLVDDVLTTGATLSEAAKALKEAGAWRVWCLTLARATI